MSSSNAQEFTKAFFQALDAGNNHLADEILKDSAFKEGDVDSMSPRAQEFMTEQGEWDVASTASPASLMYVGEDACFGALVDLKKKGTVYHRFCPKPADECTYKSHLSGKVAPELRLPRWYPSGGKAAQGVVAELRFPTQEEGGPITPRIAALLASQRKCKLRLGAWEFIHNEWADSRVDTFSSASTPTDAARIGGPDESEEVVAFAQKPPYKSAEEAFAAEAGQSFLEEGQGEAARSTVGGPAPISTEPMVETIFEEDYDDQGSLGLDDPRASGRIGQLKVTGLLRHLKPSPAPPSPPRQRQNLSGKVDAAEEDLRGNPEAEEFVKALEGAGVEDIKALIEKTFFEQAARIKVLESELREMHEMHKEVDALHSEVRSLTAVAERAAANSDVAASRSYSAATDAIKASQETEEARAAASQKCRILAGVNERIKEQLEAAAQLLEQARNDAAAHGNLPASLDEKIGQLEFEVNDPQGKCGRTRVLLGQVDQKYECGGGIECGGLSFASPNEMSVWYEDKGAHIGMFSDAITVMHSIQGSVVSQMDVSKQHESQKKVDWSTHMQASVITSFEMIIPGILVGFKKDVPGCTYEALISYLKNPDMWEPSGRMKGIGQNIIDGSLGARNRIQTLIRSRTTDSEVISVANELLTDSMTFILNLVNWISKAQRDLTHDTAYTEMEVWTMQIECLEQILEELHDARASIVDAARFDESYYLWGLINARDVQRRYVRNKFQDDPSLTGTMVRRVLLHSQAVALKDRLSGIESSVTKAEEHYRTVSGDVKGLKQSLKDVEKELKKQRQKYPVE